MRNGDGVRAERSGWRDQEISERHRDWGFNCPAVDIDFLIVEFNLGKPVALVEYKRFNAKPPPLQHATYRALDALAASADLPFFVAFYWPDIWAFRVLPVNPRARQHFLGPSEDMTEREFVTRLYTMRRRLLNSALREELHDEKPPQAGDEK